MLEVGLHGGPAHEQALGDLRVGLPLSDEFSYLQLGWGEALPAVARTLAASAGASGVGRRLVPLKGILRNGAPSAARAAARAGSTTSRSKQKRHR